MEKELKEFYIKIYTIKITDQELLLEIEKQFGQQLLKDVSIPHGLDTGTCLLLALEVAKNGSNSNS